MPALPGGHLEGDVAGGAGRHRQARGERGALAGLVVEQPVGDRAGRGARSGRPDDVAAVVELLVSAEAGWITGQNIRATGGLLG